MKVPLQASNQVYAHRQDREKEEKIKNKPPQEKIRNKKIDQTQMNRNATECPVKTPGYQDQGCVRAQKKDEQEKIKKRHRI